MAKPHPVSFAMPTADFCAAASTADLRQWRHIHARAARRDRRIARVCGAAAVLSLAGFPALALALPAAYVLFAAAGYTVAAVVRDYYRGRIEKSFLSCRTIEHEMEKRAAVAENRARRVPVVVRRADNRRSFPSAMRQAFNRTVARSLSSCKDGLVNISRKIKFLPDRW